MKRTFLILTAICALTVLGTAATCMAAAVDLTKPFEADKDTIFLFHLDDVASGEVKNAVEGGKAGKVVSATEAEGKFGKGMNGDGTKSWVDVTDLARNEGLKAMTVECWVNFRDRASADLVCRTRQCMLRVAGTANAYFSIDGDWRIVKGTVPIPVGKWTHLAMTWDEATKTVAIYVDGQLDVAATPDGITDAKLGPGDNVMRLGGHTWDQNPMNLSGQMDEVRISSVARQYAAAAPVAAKTSGTTAPTPQPVVAGALAEPTGPAPALVPWATNTEPTDVAKSHIQKIAKQTEKYTVVQGGTVDGRSCRGPMGCGIAQEGAFYQTWESNRSLRIENMGATDVVNPWISNGRNNFRNAAEIANSAIVPGMTDAEKAFAVWFQEIQYRHHAPGDNIELGDPVKVFNIYGYNTCGNDSTCMGTLWKALGIKDVPAHALGHCISQALYDGSLHFYDGDMHSVYLLRDNETVAGEQDIVRDHDLIKRTHSQGILFPNTWWHAPGFAPMYSYEGEEVGERFGKGDTTMNMTLRPGEAIEWRWGQLTPYKFHGALQTMPTYYGVPYTTYNGLWEYRPDLTKETWRKGAQVENVVSGREGLAAEEGKIGTIVWTMSSPYVFVGGRIEGQGTAQFFISTDGKTWQRMPNGNMDRFFSPVGPACYSYRLKCQLDAGSRVEKLAIINDLQMAPMAMPEMVLGKNEFTYTDETPGKRDVRITHNWVERSTMKPPQAPASAVNPPDAGECNGTDITFQWTAPADVDAKDVVDYQFELSRRPDMKLPLSMDFYKLISRTGNGSTKSDNAGRAISTTASAQYALPQPGLLNPDTKYYWHVRAQNSKGVWSSWSKTWTFTARGTACPVDLAVKYDEATGVGTLQWKPNPIGKKPAKYRIYGSDEKGFTIGDIPYDCALPRITPELAAWSHKFPANFIAETAETQFPVVGASVELPTANKAYYRVVAVDDQKKCSGPSDYTTAPRPLIYTKPLTTAKVGAAYSYQPTAIRSLGAVSSQQDRGTDYFDIEHPKYALVKGPAWLKVDSATGLLSGTPDAPGKSEVELTATTDRHVRNYDPTTLSWGSQKVISEADVRIGATTQKFVIEVQP